MPWLVNHIPLDTFSYPPRRSVALDLLDPLWHRCSGLWFLSCGAQLRTDMWFVSENPTTSCSVVCVFFSFCLFVCGLLSTLPSLFYLLLLSSSFPIPLAPSSCLSSSLLFCLRSCRRKCSQQRVDSNVLMQVVLLLPLCAQCSFQLLENKGSWLESSVLPFLQWSLAFSILQRKPIGTTPRK